MLDLPRTLRLLTEHRSLRQVVLKNTIWLGIALGFSKALEFLLTVYVVRTLGAAAYGTFTFALSFATLFSAFFDAGLALIATREFARDPRYREYLVGLGIFKAVVGLCVGAIVTAAGFLVTHSGAIRALVAVIAVYVGLSEAMNLFYAIVRSQQRMEYEAVLRAAQSCLLVVFVVGALVVYHSVFAVGIAYAGATGSMLVVVLVFALIGGYLPVDGVLAPVAIFRRFASAGMYLALSRMVGDVVVNADSVLLGYLGYFAATGWYNAAATISGAALFPMGLVASAIFPALVRAQRESFESFFRHWSMWARGTIVFSMMICVLAFAEAKAITVLVYSASFASAALALQILMVAAALLYIDALYYHSLLVFDQQRRMFFVQVTAALVNIGLNLVLVPRYSLYGAAVAVVVTRAVIVGQHIMLTAKYTPVRAVDGAMLRTLLISAGSGALMWLAMHVMDQVGGSVIEAVLAGSVVYGLSLFCLSGAGRGIISPRT